MTVALVRTPDPLPLARGGWCQCVCHSYVEGDVQEVAQAEGYVTPRQRINGLGTVAVRLNVAAEAVMACPVCRRFHTLALSGRPAELGAPPPTRILFGGGDGPETL